jgi:hypothetical protein
MSTTLTNTVVHRPLRRAACRDVRTGWPNGPWPRSSSSRACGMRRAKRSPPSGAADATSKCANRVDVCAHIDSGLWVPIQLRQSRATNIAQIRIYALIVCTVRLNRPGRPTILGCAQAQVGSAARYEISTTFRTYHDVSIGEYSWTQMLKLPV